MILLSCIYIRICLQVSESSQEFYAKANRSIWLQAAVLGTLGFFHSAVIGVRHLTVAGRGTPLLFYMLEVLERRTWDCLRVSLGTHAMHEEMAFAYWHKKQNDRRGCSFAFSGMLRQQSRHENEPL